MNSTDSNAETRYTLVRHDKWSELTCRNSPNVHLRVSRGLTVNERDRGEYPPRSIFIDGVFEGPPFYDNKRHHYSLDHHAGCVRPFTLAACEQAVVIVLQGLPLLDGEWTLYVNLPDIDAMLAAWVLINHAELRADGCALLKIAMPLIRTEGVIDAHGPEMLALTALPDEVTEMHRARLDTLMRGPDAGHVAAMQEPVDTALRILEALDAMLMPAGELDQLASFEELHRVTLKSDRIAVLASSRLGIYEVEEHLKARYENTLGILVLQHSQGQFTIRLANHFMEEDLTPLYAELNRIDPNFKEGNAWGGSGDIGGSPRGTGSALEGMAVMKAVNRIYGKPVAWYRKLSEWFGD
jgi:hypothetical protein